MVIFWKLKSYQYRSVKNYIFILNMLFFSHYNCLY